MKAKLAAKCIGRIVVVLHPGQLAAGVVLPLAMTDFVSTDQEINSWKNNFVEAGGCCLYDGPPISQDNADASVQEQDKNK